MDIRKLTAFDAVTCIYCFIPNGEQFEGAADNVTNLKVDSELKME